MWHEFTLTREEDILDHSLAAACYAKSSTARVGYCPDNAPGAPECVTPKPSDVDSFDELSPTGTQEQIQQRGKKRRRETKSCSPITRKIYIMQQQLNEMIRERAASKTTQASHQQTSRNYVESGSATELETSDGEDRRVLQVGGTVGRVLKKDAKRKVYSSKAYSTRTSRPNKQRKG